jgi:hypothetical protein
MPLPSYTVIDAFEKASGAVDPLVFAQKLVKDVSKVVLDILLDGNDYEHSLINELLSIYIDSVDDSVDAVHTRYVGGWGGWV